MFRKSPPKHHEAEPHITFRESIFDALSAIGHFAGLWKPKPPVEPEFGEDHTSEEALFCSTFSVSSINDFQNKAYQFIEEGGITHKDDDNFTDLIIGAIQNNYTAARCFVEEYEMYSTMILHNEDAARILEMCLSGPLAFYAFISDADRFKMVLGDDVFECLLKKYGMIMHNRRWYKAYLDKKEAVSKTRTNLFGRSI